MNEQQEREAFEAEMREQQGSIDMSRNEVSGAYKNQYITCAWAGWQARAALAANVPACLIYAARKVVREALDSVAVHPCDENNDTVRARGLIGPVSELHAVMLAAAPACTCPSGDGSLRWPCPEHPAPAPEADALEKAREARRQAQTETAAIKGDILKVASAVTKAGLTLVKTADGFEVRKFGPAQAQHYSTTDGTRCDNCGDALSKHTGGGRYCAEPVKPAPAQAQQPRLLPCPFCGSHVIAREGFHMTCFACGAEGTEADEANDEAAAAAWNRRAKAKPEAQQPLTDEQIMARKPASADFVSFRAGVRCVEIERASGEASNA